MVPALPFPPRQCKTIFFPSINSFFNKTFGVIGIIVFGVLFVQAESRKKKISS